MQRNLWILPRDLDVTIRLCDVPCGLYRELARRAIRHQIPFILSDGEWRQDRPRSFLRIIRRFAAGATVTFVFNPNGECQYLDAPEPGVDLYYSGSIGPDEVVARVQVNIADLLNWRIEESDNANQDPGAA